VEQLLQCRLTGGWQGASRERCPQVEGQAGSAAPHQLIGAKHPHRRRPQGSFGHRATPQINATCMLALEVFRACQTVGCVGRGVLSADEAVGWR
jgi:hypothetical protein